MNDVPQETTRLANVYREAIVELAKVGNINSKSDVGLQLSTINPELQD
jgi:hypothetical protein